MYMYIDIKKIYMYIYIHVYTCLKVQSPKRCPGFTLSFFWHCTHNYIHVPAGVLQPVREVVRAVRDHEKQTNRQQKIFVHTDAAQV